MTEDMQPEEKMDQAESTQREPMQEQVPDLEMEAEERQSPAPGDEVPLPTSEDQPGVTGDPLLDELALDEPLMEEAQPPSRLQKILAPVVRWTVLIVVVFGLGVLATMLLRVRPQKAEIELLRQDAVPEISFPIISVNWIPCPA